MLLFLAWPRAPYFKLTVQATVGTLRAQLSERLSELQSCGEEIVRLRVELQGVREQCHSMKRQKAQEDDMGRALDAEVSCLGATGQKIDHSLRGGGTHVPPLRSCPCSPTKERVTASTMARR